MRAAEIVNFLSSWGLAGVFLLALVDSMGVPLPAGVDAMVVLTAALAPQEWVMVALLAVTGSTVGCFVLYWLAWRGGEAFLSRRQMGQRARAFQDWFRRYGLLTVFVPALVPIPLPLKVFIVLSGFFRVPALHFLLTVLAARLGRYFALAYAAARVGEDPRAFFQQNAFEVSVGVVIFVLVFLLVLRKVSQLEASHSS